MPLDLTINNSADQADLRFGKKQSCAPNIYHSTITADDLLAQTLNRTQLYMRQDEKPAYDQAPKVTDILRSKSVNETYGKPELDTTVATS